jgi:predicted O-methyltransferase YrrM
MISKLDWKPQEINGVLIWTSITENEGRRLQELAMGLDVLEVGSLFGYSTVAMASVAQSVVAVDAHDTSATDSAPSSLETMLGNLAVAGVADKVVIHVGWSQDVLPVLHKRGATFGGVFIDGNHSQLGCALDLAWAWQMLEPGGFIAVHDYAYLPLPGVADAVDEFARVRLADIEPEGVTDTMWTGRRTI